MKLSTLLLFSALVCSGIKVSLSEELNADTAYKKFQASSTVITHEVRTKVEPSLQKFVFGESFESNARGVFVFPFQDHDSFRASLAEEQKKVKTRPERRQLVFNVYSSLASQTQGPILEELRRLGIAGVESFWVNNSIFIPKASRELIYLLAQNPRVEYIQENTVRAHILPTEAFDLSGNEFKMENNSTVGWNLKNINVPTAWNITQGQGVTVASIDTGVRVDHVSLTQSYRGYKGSGKELEHDYNWFDPKEFANDDWWCGGWGCSPMECCMDTPFDNVGHGTHTIGTVAGSEEYGIGVAPKAYWIGAKACRDGSCLNYGLTSSAQWIICPKDLSGKNPDCSKGADIASNSWGGSGGDMFYRSYVDAWIDAGIIPVFSAGNSGPRCSTGSSPGDFTGVFSVGATDINNRLTDFSSRGPGVTKEGIKQQTPDLVAPGSKIYSAHSALGGNSVTFKESSGTSMAAPHLSGVISLMLSVSPNLTYKEIEHILQESSNSDILLQPDNGRLGSDECGGVHWSQRPSFHHGYGLLDALKAVELAQKY